MLPGFAIFFFRARARKIPAMVFFLLSPWLPAQTLGLLYAPEAVFRGDPASFRIGASGGQATLSILSNAVAVASSFLGPEPTEFTFSPGQSTRLAFEIPGQRVALAFVSPRDPVVFTERDGYLFAGDDAAVLLPEHRKPPVLDRRWETIRLLKESLVDTRPRLGTILWLGPADAAPTGLAAKLSSQSPVSLRPDPAAWFRVHGYLLAPAPTKADFLVVDFDLHDLDRGVAPHLLIMKWQFLLQRLQAQSGFADGLFLGPDLDGADRQRHAHLDEALRSLARTHGLRFIDRGLASGEWTQRLLYNVGKEYRLP
jgi:hypothetical protein